MPSITLTLPSVGQVITSGLHASNYAALQSLLNGSLDASNLAAGSVDRSELATGFNYKVTQSDFSSGPPGSPTTGDIWIALSPLGMAGAWQFVYRPEMSGTNDWLFIGGAPYSVVNGTIVSTTSTAFTVIDGTAPSITLPRAGDYYFTMGARIGPNNGDAGDIGLMDDGSNVILTGTYNDGTGGIYYGGCSLSSAVNNIGAGSVMAMWHRTAFGLGAQFYMRYLTVIPVRVS